MGNIFRYFLLMMVVSLAATGQAARLTLRSFAPDYSDLTASTSPRYDLNGRPCALIIVELPVPGCTFQGSIVDDTPYMGSLYRVYVTEGTKMLQILCPYCEPLKVDLVDADGSGVQSKVTYHLAVDGYEAAMPGSKPSGPSGSYLTLNITPKTGVVVKIDNNLEAAENGEVLKFLLPGQHDVYVEAAGYEPYTTKVDIDNSGTKSLDIALQSTMATLTVTGTVPGTTIKVDGKTRGTDRAELQLAPGQYLVEGEKDGYRGQKEMVSLGSRERKAITLSALTPIYGQLDISYRPIGATVTIDGQTVGTTPTLLRDISIGTHEVTIAKDGYEPSTSRITVTDGETARLEGSLNEKPVEVTLEYLKKKFDDAWNFSEGLAVVKLNEKYGFVDKSGDVVIPIEYDKTALFSEGLAAVKKDDKWGFIDKKGEVVIPFEYDSATFFSEGLAAVKKDGKYGFIDKKGDVGIGFRFDEAWKFEEGFAIVKLNGLWGKIDKVGNFYLGLGY